MFVHLHIYSSVFYVSSVELDPKATNGGQDNTIPTIMEFTSGRQTSQLHLGAIKGKESVLGTTTGLTGQGGEFTEGPKRRAGVSKVRNIPREETWLQRSGRQI